MLTIPFSHVYKKMPEGVGDYRMWPQKTVMLGCRVVNRLSGAFIKYDTSIRGGGNFELYAKGPYLVIYLKTIFYDHQGTEVCRQCWTTVRCPWRRQARVCATCSRKPQEGSANCPSCGSVWGSPLFSGWQPIIPNKYREARGKEVRIVIEERGDNVAGR